MQIFRSLAGFSYGEADVVRRAMAKKKQAVMEEEGRKFIYGSCEPGKEFDGCLKRGISEKVAKELYDEMASFASYAFNKSHAAAYAYVSYVTAYLKCHYPTEFMAALLTSVIDDTMKVTNYISDCKKRGIDVLPPDINISGYGFTPGNGNIRFGLLAVKNVGRNLIESVENERRNGGDFKTFLDFCKRLKNTEMNKRAIENLIKCGALDSFGQPRKAMVQGLENVLKNVADDQRNNVMGQVSLFDSVSEDDGSANEAELPDCGEYAPIEILMFEKEVSGMYLTGHPLQKYDELIKKVSSIKISDLSSEGINKLDGKYFDIVCSISSVRLKTNKQNKTMAYLTAEDYTGSTEIIVFSSVLDQFATLIKPGRVNVFRVRVSVREDDGGTFICQQIFSADNYQPQPRRTYRERAEENDVPQSRSFTGNETLYLKIPSLESKVFEGVKAVLGIFDGTTPVVVYDESTKQRFRAPDSMKVELSEYLLRELSGRLGEGNVVAK